MIRSGIALAIGFSAFSAMAQMSPVGLWKTISDKDGTPQSEVRIVDNGGVVSANLVKVYRSTFKGDEVCVECKDDRKDKPINRSGADARPEENRRQRRVGGRHHC